MAPKVSVFIFLTAFPLSGSRGGCKMGGGRVHPCQLPTGPYVSMCALSTLLKGTSAVHLPLLPEHLLFSVPTGT